MVTRNGSQTHPGAVEYDIHVLAFPAASTRTVQGLRELFGLDAQSAQRIIASVPTILRHRLPVAEAEACAQALRKLGARVVLEPAQVREPPPPPAAAYLQHTANWPGAGRSANDSLPRPVARVPVPDLEYDVLSALDAALDGEPARDVPAPRKLAQELALDQLEEPMPTFEAGPTGSLKGGRQAELDLGGAMSRHPAPLELDGGPSATKHKPAPAPQRRPTEPQSAEREAASGTTQPRHAVAATGASRAALVERREIEPPRQRSIPLLQLLAACGVFAVGHWLDSSVLYGSAGWVSIVIHGLALQQLLLGLRGLFT